MHKHAWRQRVTCPILKSQNSFFQIDRSVNAFACVRNLRHTDAGNVEREIRCTGTYISCISKSWMHYIDAETLRRKKKNIRIRKLMYNRFRKKDNRLHNGHWFHMCNTYNIEGACSKPYEELVILSTGVSHGRAGYAKNFVIRNVSLSRNRGTDFPFGTRKIDGIYIYIFRIKFSLNKLAC